MQVKENELFREVAANPDDDTPRLVMADWYDEAGDRRGAFIRDQCEMEKLDWDSPRYIELESAVDQALAKHRAQWLKALPKWPGVAWGNHVDAMANRMWDDGRMHFRRGFAELVAFKDFNALKKNLGPLKEYGVACYADVINAQPRFYELLGTLDFVRGVSFFQHSNLDFRLIDRMTSRSKLTSLSIVECGLHDDRVKELTSLDLPSLRSLDLHFNQLDRSLGDLCQWPAAKQLKWLNLGLNDIGDRLDRVTESIENLAGQPALANLHALNLWSNGLQAEHMNVFCKRATMTRLTELCLSGNPIQDAGVACLLKGKFRSLRFLNLNKTDITDWAVAALAGNRKLVSLKRLNLSGNRKIGDPSLASIATSKHLAGLTHLNLARTGFGEEGVRSLIECDGIQSMRWLNIGDNELTSETIKALQKRFPRAVVRKPYH